MTYFADCKGYIIMIIISYTSTLCTLALFFNGVFGGGGVVHSSQISSIYMHWDFRTWSEDTFDIFLLSYRHAFQGLQLLFANYDFIISGQSMY